jgi:hypothetical protein
MVIVPSELRAFLSSAHGFFSSVIAMNLLSTDEILRAGRSSLKPDGQQ